MPVYLDDKDARAEFVESKIQGVGYDSCDFAGYIYMDGQGLYSGDSYADYKKLIDDVVEEFPYVGLGELVQDIAKVMRDEEDVWIKAWSDAMKKEKIKLKQYESVHDDDHYF
jgi:hypothetical protein